MYLVTIFLLAILFFVEWMIKLFMLPQTWKMVSLKKNTYTVHFALMMGCIWHVRIFLGRFISNLRKRQLLICQPAHFLSLAFLLFHSRVQLLWRLIRFEKIDSTSDCLVSKQSVLCVVTKHFSQQTTLRWGALRDNLKKAAYKTNDSCVG